MIYERTGRIEEAKEMYRKVIDVEEGSPTYPRRVSELDVQGETLRSIAIGIILRLESMAPSSV